MNSRCSELFIFIAFVPGCFLVSSSCSCWIPSISQFSVWFCLFPFSTSNVPLQLLICSNPLQPLSLLLCSLMLETLQKLITFKLLKSFRVWIWICVCVWVKWHWIRVWRKDVVDTTTPFGAFCIIFQVTEILTGIILDNMTIFSVFCSTFTCSRSSSLPAVQLMRHNEVYQSNFFFFFLSHSSRSDRSFENWSSTTNMILVRCANQLIN